MEAGWQYGWRLLLMAALLCGSAFCSASETAFFHLSHRQLSLFSKSALPTEQLVHKLLLQPSRFLTAILFGNMMVNVSFYSLASVFSLKVAKNVNPMAGSFCAVLFFIILVLFGEMLPKSLAYSNAPRFCRWASVPCWLGLQVLGPLMSALDFGFVRPFCRLFLGNQCYQTPRSVNAAYLNLILNSSARQGLLTPDENRILTEVVHFGFLKVRHVMVPRVDMPACEEKTPLPAVLKLFAQSRQKYLPVYRERIDNILGVLYLSDLLQRRNAPLSSLLHPPFFVPEQKTAESLLETFRKEKREFAVVVDEYGGVAGSVTLQNLLEELVSTSDSAEEEEPIQVIGPLTYRLAADLPLYEWIEPEEIEPEYRHLATVGGLVTALLGRRARPGDRVQWKNLDFTVENVSRNRISSLILTLHSSSEQPIREESR
ncbi:MAG TPA: hemolysin family protein [Anaerohalosphaeraceae bacterium]|nr:hemolysin family protein [Anaerohalosphaeraceae bacterium]HOL88639.1 hemolysin family protein [Anaerohalosphaeraceae bacterium]